MSNGQLSLSISCTLYCCSCLSVLSISSVDGKDLVRIRIILGKDGQVKINNSYFKANLRKKLLSRARINLPELMFIFNTF